MGDVGRETREAGDAGGREAGASGRETGKRETRGGREVVWQGCVGHWI